MRGDGGDPQAGALGKAGSLRERHRLPLGDRHQLCGRARRPLPLRFVDPDALADPFGRDSRAHAVHHARSVLMRNDAREGHRQVPAKAAAGLGVGGIDPRSANAHAHLTRAGLGIGELACAQDFPGLPFRLVPGGEHAEGMHERRGSRASRGGIRPRCAFHDRCEAPPKSAARAYRARPSFLTALRSAASASGGSAARSTQRSARLSFETRGAACAGATKP